MAIDDKSVEEIVDKYKDKEKRDKLYDFFKEVQTLYEILSPDAFLRPYIEKYGKLAVIYTLVHNKYSKEIITTLDLMNKTENLVKENATLEGLTSRMDFFKIDSQTLNALKKKMNI